MADIKTEKQKVKEITDKLEEGLKELFESEKKAAFLPCQNSIITVSTTRS
jgi:hypothetical protein